MKRWFLLLVSFGLNLLRADTIAVNNPAVVHGTSPYNWNAVGSTSMTAVNPGAYVKFNFTGTSLVVNFDLSNIVDHGVASLLWPVFAYTVDGIRSTHQLVSTDTSFTVATGLADTSHAFRFDLIGVDEGGTIDRWNIPTMAIVITSFTVGSGKTVTNAALLNGGWMLCYGDSITEGAVVLGPYLDPPSYAQIEDATKGYQNLLSAGLNMEYGNVAFAGQSWTGGVSNVPGLPSSYNFIYSGIPRVFVPVPNVATFNMGTNGSVTAGMVTSFMTSLRASVGSACLIVCIIPFGQYNASAIGTGYANYVSANPTDVHVQKVDLSTTGSGIVTANSYDGIHPNAAGHLLLYGQLAPIILYPLKAGNPRASAFGF